MTAVRHHNLTARMLHWSMAAAILAMLFIGVGMMASLTWRPWLLDLHRPLGIAILMLAMMRLVNRLHHPAPALPASVPRWQARAALVSHWLLYALMFALPVLGWGILSAGGYPVTVFGGFNLPAIAPVNATFYAIFRDAHALLAWLLFAVVLGHLSAALLHAWVYRDGVFSSMAVPEPSHKTLNPDSSSDKDFDMSANAFLDVAAIRRSQYALGKRLPQSQEEITALIRQAVKLSPSSFNSQSSRIVILYGAQHARFWEIVREALRKVVPAEDFSDTDKRIDGFSSGAGTVLFYEDQTVIEGLQQQFALYSDNFPIWSEQASGIAQFSVWTALAAAGLGASLQHYNPLSDAVVAAEWQIPSSWLLRAQMPFGSNEAAFGEKTYISDSNRFLVFV